MRARNSKQIVKGYSRFMIGLILSSSLSVFVLFGFIRTNNIEGDKIVNKTKEYDRIFSRQTDMTEKVDSLYNYIVMLGSNNQINQFLLQNKVSTCKMELIERLGKMDVKDVQLYKSLAAQINAVLDTKEAIRKATIDEGLIKNDLMRCIQDNKQAARRLTLGNIKVEK